MGAAACGGVVVGFVLLLVVAQRAHQPPQAPPSTKPVPTSVSRPSVGQVGYWKDPSIDPKLLERAYLGTQQPLPPEARPKPLNIHPPSAKQKRLREQVERGGMLVY